MTAHTPRRILITGTDGFVGSRAKEAFQKDILFCPSHREMDIGDEYSVRAYTEKHRPEIILHLAAISRIDVCEKDPELSLKVNVNGTVHMAKAARDMGAKLVFAGSDQVYSGCKGSEALSEDEKELHPQNVYARHKLEAEEKALSLCPESVGLRLTWMFDLPVRNRCTNPNLMMNALEALVKNRPLKLCNNDHRAMTYVREVAGNFEAMFRAPGGIYNYGAMTFDSTYQTFCQVFDLLGASHRKEELLIPFSAENPRNLLMNTQKAENAGAVFSDTAAGVLKMLREYKMI